MAEWWETFFEGVALDMWRLAVSDAQTVADADRIERLLGLPPGAKLLDAPCGNGRIALELARRGYPVTGIDIASGYIAEATERAREGRLAADFQIGDLREMPWNEAFDGAYCTGNSFGYCDDAGNERILNNVTRALRPGGRFLLECPLVAESILSRFPPNAWHLVGDIYFLAKRSFDPPTGRLNVEYTFIRDGVVDRRECSYRTYTFRQLCEMVAAAGLRVEGAWGGADRSPFTLQSTELVLLAAKD